MKNNQQKHVLQDRFIQEMYKNRSAVNVYLKNGIKLEGLIQKFDAYTILLEGRGNPAQLVFKQAIATIEQKREKGSSLDI